MRLKRLWRGVRPKLARNFDPPCGRFIARKRRSCPTVLATSKGEPWTPLGRGLGSGVQQARDDADEAAGIGQVRGQATRFGRIYPSRREARGCPRPPPLWTGSRELTKDRPHLPPCPARLGGRHVRRNAASSRRGAASAERRPARRLETECIGFRRPAAYRPDRHPERSRALNARTRLGPRGLPCLRRCFPPPKPAWPTPEAPVR